MIDSCESYLKETSGLEILLSDSTFSDLGLIFSINKQT